MPVSIPSFPTISFGEANPQLVRQQAQQALLTSILNNQRGAATLPYAASQAQADLLKERLANLYYPRVTEADIALKGSQSGLYGSEAEKNRFMVQNPGFMNPSTALLQFALAHPELSRRNGQVGTQQNATYPGNAGTSLNAGGGMVPQNTLLESAMNRAQYDNPLDPNQQAAQAANIETAKARAEQGVKGETEMGEAGMSAASAMNMLNAAVSEYEKSHYKGRPRISNLFGGGTVDPSSPMSALRPGSMEHEQQLDKLLKNLQTTIAPLQKFRNLAAPELNFLERASLSRTMEPEAFHGTANKISAALHRTQEAAQAYNFGRANGLNDAQIKQLFTKYDTEMPWWSPGQDAIAMQNLGNWQQYFSPENIAAIKSGGKVSSPLMNEDFPTVKVVRRNGKLVREK